jgi:geranylgeranyl reductase family protein
MYDVAIVGAGPGGATAALELCRCGADVILIEKQDLPRYKVCGGGLTGKAQKLLPLDIRTIAERQCTSATMTLLERGLSFTVSRAVPVISMTMRAELDQQLVFSAQKAGAKLAAGSSLLSLDCRHSYVSLATSQGPVNARFVIAADGVHSRVARAAGWPDHRLLAPAIEAEIAVSEEDLQRFSSSARFDFDVPPYGYGWVFPKRGHLSIGVLSVRSRDRDLPQHFLRYLQCLRLTRVHREERHGFFVPLSMRSSRLARNRILLVGDAAGLADPVTAEGISHALQSGQWAARALLESDFQPGKAEQAYQHMVQHSLMRELRVARGLSTLLYRSPQFRGWLFSRCGQRLVEAMTDVMAGNRSYRSIVGSIPKLLVRTQTFGPSSSVPTAH